MWYISILNFWLDQVWSPIEMKEDRYKIKSEKTLFNTGIDI